MTEDTRKYATRCLAVWEGDSPPDDSAASRTFEAFYGRFVRGGDRHEDRVPYEPATERVAAFETALLERWPNPAGEEDDHPVWEDGLVGSGTGPLVYFGVRWNMAEEVSAFAAELATSMRLVCFDVSQGKLRSKQVLGEDAANTCPRDGARDDPPRQATPMRGGRSRPRSEPS